MQTARCYTKSGSVEKYESNLWSSPSAGNWSTLGVLGTITTPDSNGNYTVTLGGDFEDSDTPTSYYCFTKYNNVINYFYFKKKGKTIKKYVISIINGPSYDYDDSNYTNTDDSEQGEISISDYKCIQVVAYYSDNTSKTLSFDDNDNPGFSIYVSYVYNKWEYDTSNQEYNTLNKKTLYTHLSSKEETYIGDAFISRVIFHRGDEDEIHTDEGYQYEQFKIIDGITQINGIPVEH